MSQGHYQIRQLADEFYPPESGKQEYHPDRRRQRKSGIVPLCRWRWS
ncbi:hypothetical protein SH139x_005364 [Planctomycetaceae bacterium SH139]